MLVDWLLKTSWWFSFHTLFQYSLSNTWLGHIFINNKKIQLKHYLTMSPVFSCTSILKGFFNFSLTRICHQSLGAASLIEIIKLKRYLATPPVFVCSLIRTEMRLSFTVIFLETNWAVATPLLSNLFVAGLVDAGGGWGKKESRAGRDTMAREGIWPSWAEVIGPVDAENRWMKIRPTWTIEVETNQLPCILMSQPTWHNRWLKLKHLF